MRGVRSLWLPFAAVAYVCFAAAKAGGGYVPWLALVLLPLMLAEVWRRTAAPPQQGEDRIEKTARSALRACFWGAAIWIAARTGPAGHPAFDAAANLGAGAAIVAALVALSRIPGHGGVMAPARSARSLDAAAFAGFLWGIAVALPATRVILPAEQVRLDPLAIDYATTSAGIGSLLVLVAATWRLRIVRRLEMGVGDRAAGALALAITAFTVAVPAALMDVAPPDRVLPVAVILASIACTWTATTREPTTVSSALRGILAIMILGAPTTLLAGLVARQAPNHAGAIVLASSAVSIVVGLIARAVARPLGPEQSRWLDAIDAASRGALTPEPDAAIRAALVALGETSNAPGARPELWRVSPEEVLSVDVAGYLHVDKAAAPDRLYEMAREEPERTLRAEVLAALEVRRPEVRPLLAWFEARRAFSATVVLDEDGPLGFILMPRGSRTAPMSLEEARAIRLLADRISALLAVSSALARSRKRELAAIARADTIDDERERLEHIIHLEAGRNESHAEQAARGVRSSAYSPAARQALEQLERLGRMNASPALIAPPGSEAVGWAALAHLASPRRGGPLVVIDGANGAEHDLELWQDAERSPLALADGGTLVVLHAALLPAGVQEHIARTLSRRANAPARSNVLPAGLVVALARPPEELAADGALSPHLSRWVGDAHVHLPLLADRPEDLRSLALTALARTGARSGGEPLGIDNAALRLLMEHSWPGNEGELRDVLTRAAAAATTRVVTATNLAAAGFHPNVEPTTASATPLPTTARRRPRPRRSPRRH